MTLLAYHNNQLFADRMVLLHENSPLERKHLQRKIWVSQCGRFAYGCAGPVIHPADRPNVERLLTRLCMEIERNAAHTAVEGGEYELLQLGRRVWYFMTRRITWALGHLDTSSGPIGIIDTVASGTGAVCFEALVLDYQPLVPEELMIPTVAAVIDTVSPEFDVIHRKSLTPFKYLKD